MAGRILKWLYGSNNNETDIVSEEQNDNPGACGGVAFQRNPSQILQVNAFIHGVKKQQPHLIRLETLTCAAVQKLMLFSYILFFGCIFASLVSVPVTTTEFGPLPYFCGSAREPLLSCESSSRITAKVALPSDTQAIQLIATRSTAEELSYSLIMQTSLDSTFGSSAVDVSNETMTFTPGARFTSKVFSYSQRYFAVQLESQYNFKALAPPVTSALLYIIFEDIVPLNDLEISIVAHSSTSRATSVLSFILSCVTIFVTYCWLRSKAQYTPSRHLPQRNWITAALVALLCYDNPIYSLLDVAHSELSQQTHFWFQTIELVGYMLVMLWLLIMSTGIAATSKLPVGFYLPKLAFMLLYIYVYFVLGLVFAFQATATPANSVLKAIYVLSVIGFQVALYLYIIFRAESTWKMLRELPYYRTRFQQLSFRVFMLQAVLLLISMVVQFSVLCYKYAQDEQSLTNESSSSFNFIGRKFIIHGIVFVMAYCYLEPASTCKTDESDREGQYVVHEADIHARPEHVPRAGLVTTVGNHLYNTVHVTTSVFKWTTSNLIKPVAKPIVQLTSYVIGKEEEEEPVVVEAVEERVTRDKMVFCVETAAKMLNIALISYYDPAGLEERTRSSFGVQGCEVASLAEQGFECDKFICDRATDTNVHVLLSPNDRIVVVFRGTGSLANWKTDINSKQRVYNSTDGRPECYDKWGTKPRIHSGFWRAYASVRAKVLSTVLDLVTENPSLPIYCTGHSLGGALATLASVDIYENLENKNDSAEVVLYNFGSPRVGNHAFAEYYDSRVVNAFRVAADGDVITGVPKHDFSRFGRHLFSTFKHVGIEVVIDPEGHGDMIVDPNLLEKKFGMRYRSRYRSHLLRSYRSGIRGLQEYGQVV